MDSVRDLRRLLYERTEELRRRDETVETLERGLEERDSTIRYLQNEIDKFRQIVDLDKIAGRPLNPAHRLKRQAISAEPTRNDSQPIAKFSKPQRYVCHARLRRRAGRTTGVTCSISGGLCTRSTEHVPLQVASCRLQTALSDKCSVKLFEFNFFFPPTPFGTRSVGHFLIELGLGKFRDENMNSVEREFKRVNRQDICPRNLLDINTCIHAPQLIR